MKHKNLCFLALLGVLLALVVCALYAGLCRRLKRCEIQVETDWNCPVVALTFDDGPNASYTPRVLDVLYEEQVPATFFLTGEHCERNKLLIREMEVCGHEIENHTFSHKDLTKLEACEIQEEVCRTEEVLRKILPDYRAQYVRPPYGRYTQNVQDAVKYPIVLWDVDSGDWKDPDAQAICEHVVQEVQDGDIVVFHDDNEETAKALRQIIAALREEGYQFVTVSQLYEHRGTPCTEE